MTEKKKNTETVKLGGFSRCPFCGSEATDWHCYTYDKRDEYNRGCRECRECQAQGPWGSKSNDIELWNRRANISTGI